MAEKDDAAYYQQHKDDPGEWEDTGTLSRGKRRLGVMVSVRFAENELEQIRGVAARRGESLSQFVREAALDRAGLTGQGRFHGMSTTGRLVPPAGTEVPRVEPYVDAGGVVVSGGQPVIIIRSQRETASA